MSASDFIKSLQLKFIVPLTILVIFAWIMYLGRPIESYQSWSRSISVNKCRDAIGEVDAVLMPAGHADPTPWFDYSHQYWDGRGPRSCDDCPGPSICPTCHNHGVSLEAGAAPPGPLALGADPAVYEYMKNPEESSCDSTREHYGAHILGAGAISGMLGGITNAITTEVIYNYRKIADSAKNVLTIFVKQVPAGREPDHEPMTVGSDGGYVRGYGNICYGAPDNASPAAVRDIISPVVRASSVGGVNPSNNVGYTVADYVPTYASGSAEEFAAGNTHSSEPSGDYFRKAVGGLEYDVSTNYASSLEPDFLTSREAIGACTTRKALSSSAPRRVKNDLDAINGDDVDAAVERSLRTGLCNTVGTGKCALDFISRGTGNARRPALDRTNGHLRDSAIDVLYREATSMGIVDPNPGPDDCTFWGAYGRPYYEKC